MIKDMRKYIYYACSNLTSGHSNVLVRGDGIKRWSEPWQPNPSILSPTKIMWFIISNEKVNGEQ
jgi:hypothetical protein